MAISFSSHSARDVAARGAGVTAVLGPTNTGKTHLAIERMLAHSSGMIGLPLRLLAREVYNKIVGTMGERAVALVTGEEKIKPANPRFWVSTVEAMPRDLDVADLERGHVFTDRMLHRRGREETLLLGAATMRQIVEKLLPGANIVSRPRLSLLTHAGEKKITRLPRRSAIVAFSSEEVYAIAELIRRQRGGAAVVLGALSPRTRNAQVELYQAGEVDYLVATDAIGMGLNLDVDHVAFASDRKFDGYQFRRLNPAELAQIAGRAGRASRDGTFGTTGRCPPFEPELVRALESHRFEPVKVLQWRNTDLDFSSLGALQASLAANPVETGLTRAPVAEDVLVLEHAGRDPEVREVANGARAIKRLWEVCQVPDYRKIAPATHAELVVTLYGFLAREDRIPIDWFARQVAQADRTDGDIDTLSTRIAHIRTWTFAANRVDWLADPEHWQGVTRGIEDKLSDALHQRLIERFVDRRTSALVRRLRENAMLETEITKTGEVVVEGNAIGRLAGLQFAADSASARPPDRGRAPDRRLARRRAEPARIMAQGPRRKTAWAAVWARRRRGRDRNCPRGGVSARRISRRAGASQDRRRSQDARPGRPRHAAEIRGALRRLPPVCAGAAQTRPAGSCRAAVGDQARGARAQGRRHVPGSRRQRPHFGPGRQGAAQIAVPRGRLPGLRRARGAGGYSRAARGPDPSAAGLASRQSGRQASRRGRRLRLRRDWIHDLADGDLGRRFRLDPAFARVSNGATTQAAGVGPERAAAIGIEPGRACNGHAGRCGVDIRLARIARSGGAAAKCARRAGRCAAA